MRVADLLRDQDLLNAVRHAADNCCATIRIVGETADPALDWRRGPRRGVAKGRSCRRLEMAQRRLLSSSRWSVRWLCVGCGRRLSSLIRNRRLLAESAWTDGGFTDDASGLMRLNRASSKVMMPRHWSGPRRSDLLDPALKNQLRHQRGVEQHFTAGISED
ncbi:MAG: hypothetical protein IPL59_17695 [Candidatus Competibacteraceae bacterium]|nr:hypothetical protein [Candidatus Competibacteraceae bacterium]